MWEISLITSVGFLLIILIYQVVNLITVYLNCYTESFCTDIILKQKKLMKHFIIPSQFLETVYVGVLGRWCAHR